MTTRFLGTIPWSLIFVLAAFMIISTWWLYHREAHSARQPYRWLLPLLRVLAISLVIFMLLEPILQRRKVTGELGQLHVVLDASKSMSLPFAEWAELSTRTRFERAVSALVEGNEPILTRLASRHEVTVTRMDSSLVPLWQSTSKKADPLPTDNVAWIPSRWSNQTALGQAIASVCRFDLGATTDILRPNTNEQLPNSSNQGGMIDRPRSGLPPLVRMAPIVIVTDGQNNRGISPLELAERLVSEGHPIFAVGMGEEHEPTDLAVLAMEAPPVVHLTDTLKGSVVVNERLPADQPYRLRILQDDREVWSTEVVSQASGRRNIDFAIKVENLLRGEALHSDGSVVRSSLPIELVAEVESSIPEVTDANNQLSMRIKAVTKRQRVLILDSDSRWETRYLRNALERDPTWQVDAFLVSSASEPVWYSQNSDPKPIPTTMEEWANYDMIVLGNLQPAALSEGAIEAIRQIVELSGCGLIWIDSPSLSWQDPSFKEIAAMLPVAAISAASSVASMSVRLTEAGVRLPALQLETSPPELQSSIWNSLPELRSWASVDVLPGGEVLAHLHSNEDGQDSTEVPFIVSRWFGAGRVVYFSSDETWRWRYRVADLYHQRFWNQISRWVMRYPYAVETEFVSLDAGKADYVLGEPITIRARLRDSDGSPLQAEWAEARLEQNGRTVATLSLSSDPSIPGVYQGVFEKLPAGSYQVHIDVAGIQKHALDAEVDFRVIEPPDEELSQLACNSDLLQQLAERSGGAYLPEPELHRLPELLEKHSQGRIESVDIVLWQSFYWFIPIVGLLSVEWLLRKRAGLI